MDTASQYRRNELLVDNGEFNSLAVKKFFYARDWKMLVFNGNGAFYDSLHKYL